MADELDLYRVRHGEPKYLIRELMHKKYPGIPVPDKVPMPRPVDAYFKSWEGPIRPEFKKNLDMTKFTDNKKVATVLFGKIFRYLRINTRGGNDYE